VDRAQKEAVIDELGQIFTDSGVVVVAHYEGLTVAEMTNLRLSVVDAGGAVRVAKNKLAKIALEGKAKAVVAFAKDNEKLVILGGSMGDDVLDPAGVKVVASMPSREELLASIASMLGAPASNIAGAIGAPASNIAGILSTLEDRAEA